jgi:hypothetical protein
MILVRKSLPETETKEKKGKGLIFDKRCVKIKKKDT